MWYGKSARHPSSGAIRPTGMVLTRLDFFPKTYDELSERTLSGALISVLGFLFILWAAAHELQQCMAVEMHHRLLPQTSAEHGNVLSVNLDVIFPALPCSEIVLELTDSSGKEQACQLALYSLTLCCLRPAFFPALRSSISRTTPKTPSPSLGCRQMVWHLASQRRWTSWKRLECGATPLHLLTKPHALR